MDFWKEKIFLNRERDVKKLNRTASAGVECDYCLAMWNKKQNVIRKKMYKLTQELKENLLQLLFQNELQKDNRSIC